MSTKAEVTPVFVRLVFLAGLVITPSLSQHCYRLNDITLENVKLMSSMIGSVIQCIKDINAFEFPKEILSLIQPVKRLIKEAFYEMSTQSLSIFNQLTFNSTQGKKYLQELEIGLFEQIEKVQECLQEENEVKEDDDEMEYSDDSVLQRVHLELRNYFIRIKIYLRKKKFSNCAWKIVGVEIRRCFLFFHDLTKLLKRE